jgi:hypothetical protein
MGQVTKPIYNVSSTLGFDRSMFLWCAIAVIGVTVGIAIMIAASGPHESLGIAVPP